MSLTTRDLTPRIATEIRVDKQTLLSGEHAGKIRELLDRRGVLAFPQINFTDEEQIRFTQTLGVFARELRGEEVFKITLDTKVNTQACTARHVVGMDFKKSAELLVQLRDWATQPRFVYRHKWSVGDLVIWDNTGTMHRATPYDPKSGRLLHRTKLQGEEAFA